MAAYTAKIPPETCPSGQRDCGSRRGAPSPAALSEIPCVSGAEITAERKNCECTDLFVTIPRGQGTPGPNDDKTHTLSEEPAKKTEVGSTISLKVLNQSRVSILGRHVWTHCLSGQEHGPFGRSPQLPLARRSSARPR